ncbi:hypothetical protein M2284_003390 [Rhodococcus sp. LBL1]|nr:hypothetical protein [Rhodococcus sp. LBL1]MDH6685086.1 hypothetical protein [Rhodococcus sp. LBL2]
MRVYTIAPTGCLMQLVAAHDSFSRSDDGPHPTRPGWGGALPQWHSPSRYAYAVKPTISRSVAGLGTEIQIRTGTNRRKRRHTGGHAARLTYGSQAGLTPEQQNAEEDGTADLTSGAAKRFEN